MGRNANTVRNAAIMMNETIRTIINLSLFVMLILDPISGPAGPGGSHRGPPGCFGFKVHGATT